MQLAVCRSSNPAAWEAVAMGKPRSKPNYHRRVLRLPDLDHCKAAVLNNLGSPDDPAGCLFRMCSEAGRRLWERILQAASSVLPRLMSNLMASSGSGR